jgi:hypothetical protein
VVRLCRFLGLIVTIFDGDFLEVLHLPRICLSGINCMER